MVISKICVNICGATVFSAIALASGSANAQSKGDTTVGVGWLHIMPQSKSDPLVVESVNGALVNQVLPGTGLHADAGDTASLTVEHYFTDHIGVALMAAMPFTNDLSGDGALSRYGVIGKTKPMAPILELRYHFFDSAARFRPFAGVGVNYTWFESTRATNGAFVSDTCGQGCSMQSKLSASWNPSFTVGLSYKISKKWAIDASATYIPLSTTLTSQTRSVTGVETVTKAQIKVHPIISRIEVSYSF
ncbi:OmpW family protein [Burkholderia sp. Ac-20345]|uniref:OmpW/AlkL family protein n=1 Tax=Burkholderia sp. Ac-20345 TaxID=2703891 RepID=UPI00197C9CBD|nr:OmpW family outer membrane protein [Burkholderia sp. Ac-20345]MBN3782864.1 OmpW family protein [Burkholderia sp. Ac-20345]